MKNILRNISIFLIAAAFFMPSLLQAMTLQIERPLEDIHVNDVVVLSIYLDTDGKEINALDGSISLAGDFEVKTISLAGSIFDLWPNKPSLEGNTISFIGGSTSGVYGSRLKIFSVALKPIGQEEIVFTPKSIDVFLNDGKGSKESIKGISKKIAVNASVKENKNELEAIILADKSAPEDFEVAIGRDQNLYDGKYFASFNTTDKDSGVNRYEVIEEGYASVRSGNTYVLQNQNLDGTLIVKAIDNAGNIRTVETDLSDANGDVFNWPGVLIAVVLLLIIFYVLEFLKKRKNNNF